MTAGRIISGLITALLLLRAVGDPDSGADISVILGLLVPLALIWFPEEINDFTLGKWTQGGIINKPTPPGLVSFIGWILFALMVGAGIKKWIF